jgi:hypothetical protein
MTATFTVSGTSAFTEARARAVMRHVLGDFMSVASAGLIARETIATWHEELEYAVLHEVVASFQLQFKRSDGARFGLEYTVLADGTVAGSSKAGGVDFHELWAGTPVSLHVTYRHDAPRLEKVLAYLRSRGWTAGGSRIGAVASRDRTYSKDGFGITRGRVGDWG